MALFAGWSWDRPETVFFPTGAIKIDPCGALRAPYAVPEGSTYSVISSVPNASPDQLRSAGTVYPEEIASRYTQLPPNGLERTSELASRLTEGTTNPYRSSKDEPVPQGNLSL